MLRSWAHHDGADLGAPQMAQIAKGDDCFLFPDAAVAAEHLAAIYAAAGAREALELHLFDGVHEIDVEPALEFFGRRL